MTAPRALPEPLSANLSEEDRVRLLRYRIRYALESRGFTRGEAERLLFLDWMADSGRISERIDHA